MPRAFIRALGLIKHAAAERERGARRPAGPPSPRRSRRPHSRSPAGAARRPVSGRRIPDRLGHQQQHECERGDCHPRRRAGSARRCIPTTRSTWSEQQRRGADRDPRRRPRCCSSENLLPALRALERGRSRRARAGSAGVGQDRPHASDGRDADHARPGARRLAQRRSRRAAQRLRVGRCRGCIALAQGGTAVGTGINADPRTSGRRSRGISPPRPASRSRRAVTISRRCRARTRRSSCRAS